MQFIIINVLQLLTSPGFVQKKRTKSSLEKWQKRLKVYIIQCLTARYGNLVDIFYSQDNMLRMHRTELAGPLKYSVTGVYCICYLTLKIGK